MACGVQFFCSVFFVSLSFWDDLFGGQLLLAVFADVLRHFPFFRKGHSQALLPLPFSGGCGGEGLHMMEIFAGSWEHELPTPDDVFQTSTVLVAVDVAYVSERSTCAWDKGVSFFAWSCNFVLVLGAGDKNVAPLNELSADCRSSSLRECSELVSRSHMGMSECWNPACWNPTRL